MDCNICSTLHLSNFSVGIQYGDEIPIRQCGCKCHEGEDSIHGKFIEEQKKKGIWQGFNKLDYM